MWFFCPFITFKFFVYMFLLDGFIVIMKIFNTHIIIPQSNGDTLSSIYISFIQ